VVVEIAEVLGEREVGPQSRTDRAVTREAAVGDDVADRLLTAGAQ